MEDTKQPIVTVDEDATLNPFERQMKLFFPEVFQLHVLGKTIDEGGEGEVHIWTLVKELLEMHRASITGTVFISYSKGRIDKIDVKRDVLAHNKNRPGY